MAFLLLHCFVGVSAAVPVEPAAPALPPTPPNSLRFFAVGDWGADNDGQHADATGMESVAQAISPTFAVMLGDNFYTSGIHGDAHDPRFESTFEKVYTGPALDKMTFYGIAGNHDHKGNVSAQIAYTDASPTQRWKYPDWWFGKSFTVPGTETKIEILLIDTVIGLGNTDDNVDRWGQPPGPQDEPSAKAQWEWLEQRMQQSTADYLWVGGHYPVWSICSHGPTQELVKLLKPTLEQFGAHYFSGHDHCEGHINEGTGVEYIVTGAGQSCCYEATNTKQVPEGSIKFFTAGAGGSSHQKLPLEMKSGFTSYYVYPEYMQVVFHAHDGTVLYKTPQIKPRSQKAAVVQATATELRASPLPQPSPSPQPVVENVQWTI